MSLIKKPHELNTEVFPAILIYGQPGGGKSTLALSAPRPLMFDFDRGVHRVNTRHQADTVQIESWQNMLDVLNNENLKDYQSFIVDTAGKMLDYMGLWLIQNNPKLGKANGALSLQGYGERKAEFRAFLKRVRLMGKILVFVAHDQEEKDGDMKIIRPEIGGSSGSDLVKELDLVGYVQMIGNQRTISFDPCERFYGKNTCGLPSKIDLADVVNGGAPNTFLTKVAEEYQANLGKRKELGLQYAALMETIKSKIESIDTPEKADLFGVWAGAFTEHIWDSKLQMRTIFSAKIKALNYVYDKALAKYSIGAAPAVGATPAVTPTVTPAAEEPKPTVEPKAAPVVDMEDNWITKILTEADFLNNPELLEQGLMPGDSVSIPKNKKEAVA